MPIWLIWAGRLLLIGGGLAAIFGVYQGTKQTTQQIGDWVVPVALGIGLFIVINDLESK